MKKYVVILLVMFLSITSYGGVPFEVYFEESNSSQSYVEVDVKVRDFVDVSSFQIYIEWDKAVLDFSSVSYTHNELSPISFHDFWGSNVLSGSWDNVPSPKTFVDGTTIFTIKFNYSGKPNDKTFLKVIDYTINQKSLATYELNGETFEVPIRGNDYELKIPGDGGSDTTGTDGFCLHLAEVTGPAGSIVCVPITVNDFDSIGSLQFGVSWDTTILSWQNEGYNWARGVPKVGVQSNVDSSNLYKYIMNSPLTPLFLDDGETLVELCFEVNPNAKEGDVGNIQFNGDSLPFDVVTFDNSVVDWCGTQGKVSVGDVDRTVTFKASNETADLNEKVCVSITALQFKEIETFQFMLNWDSDVMTYDTIGDVNKVSITPGILSVVDDENIRISWDNNWGVTLPDDDTLFQLCYDVVGDCNSSTDFKIIGSDIWNPGIEVSSKNIPLPHKEIFGSVKVKCSIVIDSVAVQNPTCPGSSNGFIKVYLQNPSNYKFNWSHNANELDAIANGLPEGEYTVTITDKYDNSIQTEITKKLTAPQPINVTEKIVNESCDTKGSISLEVIGLTPPYTYVWSNGSTTRDISDLEAGNYSVTINDSNNCGSYDFSYSVGTDVEKLDISGNMTDITCHDSNDGSIEVAVDKGCEPYTIVWSDGVKDQLTRSDLADGNYEVTVTDGRGDSKSLSFSITNPEQLVIDGVISNGIPGSIDVTVTGGKKDYSYSWTGPNNFTSTQEDIDNLEEGSYTLRVTDSRGCAVEKVFEVVGIIENIKVEVIVNTDINNGQGVKCHGDCNGSIDAVIEANAPWSVYLDGKLIVLPYNEVCGGNHTLKISDNLDKTVEVTFNMPEPAPLTITPEVTCSDRNEDNGKIEVSVNGGYGEYTFEWNGLTGEDSPILSNLAPGKYSVLVTDENGCETLSNQIKVNNCYTGDCYEGSLILTPNGDGFNDVFLITCADDFDNNDLKVFDRIGNEVYSQNNYDGTWNGVDKSGNKLIEDSYMWVFIGVNENGIKEVYKGTVTILRD